jgi:ABC-2 type transport system ATP-binding protein
MAAVSIQKLVKRYAERTVVDGLDLEIASGEVFALLGPNGAGKTTTVEILEGFRRRDAGTVEVLGVDPERGTNEWRARIGVVLQGSGAFDELTPTECLKQFASVFDNPLPIADALAVVGLTDSATQRIAKLSGGQRRRLEVACGIVGRPELLFLDEPTTGLDPEARRGAWDLVSRLAEEGTTILLTTHYLDEAEALADRVGIIVDGRLVALGSPAQLEAPVAGSAEIRVLADDRLVDMPKDIAGDGQRHSDGSLVVATKEATRCVQQLISWAHDHGVDELPGLSVRRPNLEDVYLTLVKQYAADSVATEAKESE